MGATALAAPHLPAAAGVPVLVSGLSQLGPHLHQVVWVGLHQRLGREQAQICAMERRRGAKEEKVRGEMSLIKLSYNSLPFIFTYKIILKCFVF